MMGSVAYGVSSDTSDVDVYGWAIPPKDDLFPHLRGEVPGFGEPRPRFEQYQEHHIRDQDALAGHGRMYDVRQEFERLRAELEASSRASRLPDGPSARPALNDLLIRLRLQMD
jgi:hypothetical protein